MTPGARNGIVTAALLALATAAAAPLAACERSTGPAGTGTDGAVQPAGGGGADAASTERTVLLEYEVDGMHCSGCVEAIEDRVSKLPGIARCTVDLEARRALVEASGADRDAAIRSAIERLGYTVRTP